MQILYPLIGLFKSFRAIPRLIALKSLTSTRWCWRTKSRWLFCYVGWYRCQLFILLSKLTSSRWRRHSKLAIEKGIFFFYISPRRGKRNSKSNTCFLWVNIGCLEMRYLIFFCLSSLTSSLFPGAWFFVWDGNHML
jgi:hypothetical protein